MHIYVREEVAFRSMSRRQATRSNIRMNIPVERGTIARLSSSALGQIDNYFFKLTSAIVLYRASFVNTL